MASTFLDLFALQVLKLIAFLELFELGLGFGLQELIAFLDLVGLHELVGLGFGLQ